MTQDLDVRIAIVYPGPPAGGMDPVGPARRFPDLFDAFGAIGIAAEVVPYDDLRCAEVRAQLLQVDAVLVWVNPVEDGRDRSVLDTMLREVAAAGVFVSTHPEVILKLGTKEVLYRTRALGWGCDTHLYLSLEQMSRELPLRLAQGQARVLKQYRGNGGDGVWKVEPLSPGLGPPGLTSIVRARHAKRGCQEEQLTLAEFLTRCEPYFASGGRMIDQAYQDRLPEGMVRCYLVHDKVVGFGHQAINALFPAPPGAAPGAAPQPGPRLYHPASLPEFAGLKQRLERDWVPAVQRLLDISHDALPIIWDCDFLLGPKGDDGADSHVLCEINVSCVSPYPPAAAAEICRATAVQARSRRARRTAAA